MNKLRGWHKRFFFFIILFKGMNKMFTYLTQFPSEYIQKRKMSSRHFSNQYYGNGKKNNFLLTFYTIFLFYYLQWKSRWCIMRKLSPVAGMCSTNKNLNLLLKLNSQCSPNGILLLLQKHIHMFN